MFICRPFEESVGKVANVVPEIVAIMPCGEYGREAPFELKVSARHDLGDCRIGKKGICIQIGGEARLFPGPLSREQEMTGADRDLLDFLVAVLHGKDVMVVGCYSGPCEGGIFNIGLEHMLISMELPTAVEVELRPIIE